METFTTSCRTTIVYKLLIWYTFSPQSPSLLPSPLQKSSIEIHSLFSSKTLQQSSHLNHVLYTTPSLLPRSHRCLSARSSLRSFYLQRCCNLQQLCRTVQHRLWPQIRYLLPIHPPFILMIPNFPSNQENPEPTAPQQVTYPPISPAANATQPSTPPSAPTRTLNPAILAPDAPNPTATSAIKSPMKVATAARLSVGWVKASLCRS